jgi:hypothetical protein
MDRQRVLEVAARVRAAAELLAERKKRRADLGGMCAIVSAALVRALWQAGIASELVEGHYRAIVRDRVPGGFGCWHRYPVGHCWVHVGGFVLDLTATQFGEALPPVFMTSCLVTAAKGCYVGRRAGDVALEVLEKGWPRRMRPGVYAGERWWELPRARAQRGQGEGGRGREGLRPIRRGKSALRASQAAP